MSLTHLKRVKIYGAGSIGNHLAHASRRLGCEVVVCDIAAAALERMKTQIYPSRYGSWDERISLHLLRDAPRGDFDLICVGTPPESHVELALDALTEAPKALQIEKPLCPPGLNRLSDLISAAALSPTQIFVGYDHVVGRAARALERLLNEGSIGTVTTFDVEFREHWGGIFRAHSWLTGPADSYLGFWRRGGGASGEHSHAMNFWQFLSHTLGHGRVADVSALVRYVARDRAEYDDLCFCTVRTESGLAGRIVQDVVTQPVKKEALLVGTTGTLRWVNGYDSSGDAVIVSVAGREPEIVTVPKTRPDDFLWELEHIDASLAPGARPSPMALDRGVETMMVIAAAHESQRTGQRIPVDYGKLERRDEAQR